MLGNAWNAIKGAIVEDDAPAATTQAAAVPPKPVAPGVTPAYASPSVNQAMVEMIRKTFDRNTALTALLTASNALQDIIPDPVMRLKAAQKTAGAGRSAKEFSEAVEIHLADVIAAENTFAAQLDGKIKAEVGGLQRQAEAAENQTTAMNQEIQNLQQRIQQLQQQSAEQTTNAMNLRAQAAAKEAELRQADVEFKAAATHVRNELNGHKATILSTLG